MGGENGGVPSRYRGSGEVKGYDGVNGKYSGVASGEHQRQALKSCQCFKDLSIEGQVVDLLQDPWALGRGWWQSQAPVGVPEQQRYGKVGADGERPTAEVREIHPQQVGYSDRGR